MKIILETRRVKLCPSQEEDIPLISLWENKEKYLTLCTIRKTKASTLQQKRFLGKIVNNNPPTQFVIKLKRLSTPIGTICVRDINFNSKYGFLSIYIDDKYINTGYGVDACALFIKYLFDKLHLYKIYLQVFEYNKPCLSIVENPTLNFSREGIFKNHRLINGRRYNLITFAAYQEHLDRVEKVLYVLSCRKQSN